MSCAQQAEEGSWITIEPTRGITKVELRFNCQDQVLNGQPYPPGPPWYIRLFGSCEPNDCDWGETGATRLSSGQIHGSYNQGFAQRSVYLQVVAPDQLWLYVATHFTDNSGRADYASENWYKRSEDTLRIADIDVFRKRKVAKGAYPTATRMDPLHSAHEQAARDVRAAMPTATAKL